MKINEVTEQQRIDEALPALLIPALVSAIRVGGPKALGWLAKRGAAGAARGAAGAGRFALKRPVTTALGATGIAGYNTLKDMIPEIPEELKAFMGKYAIPAAAVLGVLYGGKKLYDYLKNKEKTKTQESIDNNLKNFLAETTSAGAITTSMGGGNGFVNGGPGTLSRAGQVKTKRKKKKKK